MKIDEVLYRIAHGQIRVSEAAQILRVSERTIRRYRARCRAEGTVGLFDRRCLRPSPRRYPEALRSLVRELFREEYSDFNVTHFYEKLREEHGVLVSYTWVKDLLKEAGLVQRGRKRGRYRRRRQRRPLQGMLLHLDGSSHRWLGAKGPVWDLLVVADDATSEVYAAHFVAHEDTRSCLRILREVVLNQGAFTALYTDRASHFVRTQEARKGPDRSHKTQVERALNQLGIELICAHSPQARGRGERLFGTWQGRLVPELRRAGIKSRAQANRFLREVFIDWHNKALTVAPRQSGSAFTPVRRKDLDRVFSIQHSRTVHRDHTIQFQGRAIQIRKLKDLGSLERRHVTLYEHLDGLLTIGWGERSLGCYDADGRYLCANRPKTRTVAA